jgi:hypothetical protein
MQQECKSIFGWVRLANLYLLTMAKPNTITIDLNKWTTQSDKARNYPSKNGNGCTVEYICKLIRKGKLKSWKIEEIGVHLVER